MAIEKYTTECIVVEAYDNGEHDRAYKLFTRDFGLVTVHAKSVRKLESKLRAHIRPRGMSLATLVQGREVWRLVGAEERDMNKEYIHEITSLIKRFIRGEGAHKALYDRIILFTKATIAYDQSASRVLLYYIFLVELGYADAKVIGAKNIQEYSLWSIDDLHTHFVLTGTDVRKHVHEVLKEMQL